MNAPEPGPASARTGWLLFAAALVVYGATLGARDVWGEECFLAQDRPWTVLGSFLAMDRWAGRPPAFYSVRSLTIALLGIGPWGMRLPALLFGAAAVPVTWRLARRVLTERGALLAAGALVLAALPGYFARESHVYSLSVLLAAALGHVALDVARGRPRPARAGLLTLASLWSSIMLWPMTALLAIGGGLHLRRRGGDWRRFVRGQAGAWGVSLLLWGVAFARLAGRGGGVLDMGGEDGDGGRFTENSLGLSLDRAVDGLVFSHQGPLGGTPLEGWLPWATAAAVLALLARRGGAWSLGGLAVASFVGAIVPFWALSWGFGHDHRLDARYFVHLAPFVVVAWAAAIEALPARPARWTAAALLVFVLGWGTVRAQSPPNRAVSELAATVAARAEPHDVGFGPPDFFRRDETCLEPIDLPLWDGASLPPGTERIWVVHDKDDDDRFPPAWRRAAPGVPPEFALAFERLVRPELHEEFGQVVVLARHDRGATARPPSTVTLEVDASAWPLTGGPTAVRLYALKEFPLRERPWDAELLGEHPLEGAGPVRRATVDLPEDAILGWEVVLAEGRLPWLGEWPRPLDQRPFTVHAVDALEPTVRASLPAVWDPILARSLAVALLVLCGLVIGGSGLAVWRRYQSAER